NRIELVIAVGASAGDAEEEVEFGGGGFGSRGHCRIVAQPEGFIWAAARGLTVASSLVFPSARRRAGAEDPLLARRLGGPVPFFTKGSRVRHAFGCRGRRDSSSP